MGCGRRKGFLPKMGQAKALDCLQIAHLLILLASSLGLLLIFHVSSAFFGESEGAVAEPRQRRRERSKARQALRLDSWQVGGAWPHEVGALLVSRCSASRSTGG